MTYSQTLIAAAVAAFAAITPAVAAPSAVRTLNADNKVITYTVETQPDGSYILASTPDSQARPFRLRVAKGWVNGKVDGDLVSFRAPAPKRSRISAD